MPRKPAYAPPAVQRYVVEARERGDTIKTIARHIRLTPAQVAHCLRVLGVKKPTRIPHPLQGNIVSIAYKIKQMAQRSIHRAIADAHKDWDRARPNGEGKPLEW
jgi:hypothetical protein